MSSECSQDLLNQLVLYCLLTVACNIAVAVLHSLLDGTSEQYTVLHGLLRVTYLPFLYYCMACLK